jgi:hypothetical protein
MSFLSKITRLKFSLKPTIKMTSEIVIRVPSENIVAESKISFNIKDFKNLEIGETIATSKTEFLEIDACW